MKRCIFLMTVLFTWALLSAPARAALVCEADMVLLDFGASPLVCLFFCVSQWFSSSPHTHTHPTTLIKIIAINL